MRMFESYNLQLLFFTSVLTDWGIQVPCALYSNSDLEYLAYPNFCNLQSWKDGIFCFLGAEKENSKVGDRGLVRN